MVLTKQPTKAPSRVKQLRLIRSGLYEEAAGRLRALIVRGDLRPGEQLVEASLCDALGVSRTPLREALKLLAAEGLVQLRLNRSSIVTPMHPEEIGEVFEAIAGIERIAAELAALRMTRRDHERLAKLHLRLERHHDAGELREYFDVNQQIHAFIVSCSYNRALRSSHESLMGRAERARFFALHSQARWDESVEEHRTITQALLDHDSDRAGRLLAHHVQRTGQVVTEALKAEAGEEQSSAEARPSSNATASPAAGGKR